MAAALDPYDVPIVNFLVGRFARESLRTTLDGLVLSDMSEMDMEEFLAGVDARDYHLARVFWVKVLTPVWEAWTAWAGLAAERAAVDVARRSLQDAIAAAQGNGAGPNNRREGAGGP
jgi:hypothetical protein